MMEDRGLMDNAVVRAGYNIVACIRDACLGNAERVRGIVCIRYVFLLLG